MHLPNFDLDNSSEMEPRSPTKSFFISKHTETMPNDIIFNILMKLPVKSLLRFRLVCKNWDSIIRSQTFELNYSISRPQGYLFQNDLQVSSIPSKPYIIVCENSFSKITKLEIPSNLSNPSHDPIDRIVVGSCNGLVCITNFKQFGHELYIWNPSIRKQKILTTTSLFTGRFRQRFKHPKTSIAIALGFDSKIKDYKIIRIACFNWKSRRIKNKPPPEAEIYTLGTDSWRRLELTNDITKRIVRLQCRDYAYINGGFHWLTRFKNEKGKHYSSILRFDVEEERFREVKLPKDYLNDIQWVRLRVAIFKGFLGLIMRGHSEGQYKCCIWMMMNNDGSLWTKQDVKFAEKTWHYECVGDKLVLAKENSKVFLFDPQTLQQKTLNMPRPASVHVFTETLALL